MIHPNYTTVTELAGSQVTQEQVQRLYDRYHWAALYCDGKDVVEVACGNGAGLGYLARKAKTISAGDISPDVLRHPKHYYGSRIHILEFDAISLPYSDRSKDIIILFEAIYYLPDPEKFIQECRRVLRPDGAVLISTANKDLYDFNPSPFSKKYYGVVELTNLFSKFGFHVNCFGNFAVHKSSFRQKALRPMKKLAVSLNLIPKTMHGKKILKQLVFGKLVPYPTELEEESMLAQSPTPLSTGHPDSDHKIIFCEARLTGRDA